MARARGHGWEARGLGSGGLGSGGARHGQRPRARAGQPINVGDAMMSLIDDDEAVADARGARIAPSDAPG